MEGKHVGIELRKLVNLITREASKKTKEFPGDNITEMHVNIIDYLVKAGEDGAMQKELEEAFTIRKSTASRILTLMEKNGMIERRGVAHDARLKKIVLTPSATAHHKMMIQHAEEFEQQIIAGIPEKDLNNFFSVLETMQNNLKE